MNIFAKIRAELDTANPRITEEINGESVEVTGAKREALLDTWTENTIERGWILIRRERDARLVASDWTQVADAQVNAKAWAEYRQALRDLPATIKDPTADVAWPEPPK